MGARRDVDRVVAGNYEHAKLAMNREAGLSLSESVIRGIIGFTVLSVAGFAPWALGGRWFYRNVGEAGLYATCAVVFIGLSGPLLHRLLVGPASLARFYKVFGIAFTGYAIACIVGWMSLRGHTGSIVGLLAGAVVMACVFAQAFQSWRALPTAVAALFALSAAGYFIGGWVEGAVAGMDLFAGLSRGGRMTIAKLLWGVCYGVGFGAGLGIALHVCQRDRPSEPQSA